MHVWLVTIGEPLPRDGCQERLLRTGILADHLSREGHQVSWWTSAFDHVRKKQRSAGDERIAIAAGYNLWLLHANRYSRNVSLRRIINHRSIARKFRKLAPREPRPDVILCSWPTVELCVEAVRLGNIWGVPVVLDIRDMWPDAILDLAPRVLRPAARIAMRSAYQDARYAASHATAITGITDKIVDWGLRFAGRSRSEWDRAFAMGYQIQTAASERDEEALEFWRTRGISGSKSAFIVCFFGTIGRHFEFETVFRAARRLEQTSRGIKFVLCGDGPHLSRWRQSAAACPNIILPGWVDAAKIRSLMRLSSAGLAPYVSSWDFAISIPNKPVEYLSAGLPVVSSLQGELAELLAINECGLTYRNGSADDLVRVLADCYDHPTKLAKMAENAARLYQSRFVAETIYGQMGDYLNQVACRIKQSHAA